MTKELDVKKGFQVTLYKETTQEYYQTFRDMILNGSKKRITSLSPFQKINKYSTAVAKLNGLLKRDKNLLNK